MRSASLSKHRIDKRVGANPSRTDCAFSFVENSARTGTQRPSCQRTRPHTEARAQRRRYGLQQASTARTAAFAHGQRSGGIGTHPVTAHIALRVNALHGEPGQILHRFPSAARCFRPRQCASSSTPREPKNDGGFCANRHVVSRRKTTRYRGTLPGVESSSCGFPCQL